MLTASSAGDSLGSLPDYDGCNGQPNGRMIHPTDCTRYIECSNDLAYEFSCAECDEEDNPGRCYKGHTIFDAELAECNWADVTPCKVGADDDEEESGNDADL